MSKLGYQGEMTLAMQVKDAKAAIAWYTKVLGFEVLYHMEEMGWCELKSPVAGVNLGLSQVEKPKIGGGVPTWGVKDIASARKQLESQKVRFDGDTITIEGLVKLASFFDPDGNAHMLFQSLSPPAAK